MQLALFTSETAQFSLTSIFLLHVHSVQGTPLTLPSQPSSSPFNDLTHAVTLFRLSYPFIMRFSISLCIAAALSLSTAVFAAPISVGRRDIADGVPNLQKFPWETEGNCGPDIRHMCG
ncbi:hypothetical protein EIP91_011633 [Steccherinum ochraceum]|uniref:Uncharacterized protein n=1 Tax=Steccherinum ochraceum TaxID=92696 RepID=A0A4R0RLI2_9APHY|nr:hypothetical protein EIP91_011633 [Steccherinum ochraceum]